MTVVELGARSSVMGSSSIIYGGQKESSQSGTPSDPLSLISPFLLKDCKPLAGPCCNLFFSLEVALEETPCSTNDFLDQ